MRLRDGIQWVVGFVAILAVSGVVGCGGCDDEAGAGGSTEVDGAAGADGEDLTRDSTVDATEAVDGTGPTDGWVRNDGHTRADGTVSTDGETPTDGSGGVDGETGVDTSGGGDSNCPGTKTECDGKCVSTRLDPDNCGSCGNTCTGQEVCNAGECTDSCPFGMNQCGNRCVDFNTDDDYCGDCSNSCGPGTACNHGDCTNVVTVGSPPSKCSGGGPTIDVGYGDQKKKCTGRVASTTFRWAICSCDDITIDNDLRTDAYDSTAGPYEPGGLGGGIGTNGEFRSNNKFWIWGALWSSSTDGITAGNEGDVKLQLHSQGDVTFENDSDVRGDAFVGADVVGNAPVTFHQTLHLPSMSSIRGDVTTNNTVRQPVNISPVCRRCQPGNSIPIQKIVDGGKNNNENAAIGLDTDALVRPGDTTVLRLPCGRYYLSEIDLEDETAITTTGRTALFIGGDVNSEDRLLIKPTPGSELDVFIAGDVSIQSDVEVGSAGYPASTRLYVGGPNGWNVYNKSRIGAYVYALPGGVYADNDIDHFGGLYTQNIETGNKVRVHFDRSVLNVDRDCPDPTAPPPNPDAGTGDADGGTSTDHDTDGGSDGGTSTGRDADGGSSTCFGYGSQCSANSECCDYDCIGGSCGPNCTSTGGSCSADSDCCDRLLCSSGTCGETCSDQGESCTADGDCCAPLVCRSGVCETTSCNNLYESCSSDSDCCSGSCACAGNSCQCVSG